MLVQRTESVMLSRPQISHRLRLYSIAGFGYGVKLLEVEAPRFQDNRHMRVVRLSALRTGRLYSPPGNIPGTHFCSRLTKEPQCGRKNYANEKFRYTIGNRTRDLLACSAVPQSTEPPRAVNIISISPYLRLGPQVIYSFQVFCLKFCICSLF